MRRYLGHGVGLRVPHYERALRGALDVDFVEVITENFFGKGGRPRAVLEAVRREKPLVFHGVSLGVGSLAGPDLPYLSRVAELADAFEPAWISDHVCWTRLDGRQSHELLPLPFTAEALQVVIDNTQRVQEFLGRPLLLENVSSYVEFKASEMREWEFLAELVRRSGCSLLLDLNNVLVGAHNHGFSPQEYLAGLPPASVVQLHLANHSLCPGYRFDDHRGPVPEQVWSLLGTAFERFGLVSSIVEWDEELPAWEDLATEAGRARQVAQRFAHEAPPAPREPTPVRRGQPHLAPSREPAPASLEQTQRLLFAALTWPEGVADFVANGGESVRTALAATCVGRGELGPSERLDIYANAYFYRLLGVLRELFPRTLAQLGEVPFHNLVTRYVLQHPSTSPDLNDLGGAWPAFLRAQALGGAAAALPDLAELELALGRALHAPDAEPLTHADLLALEPGAWPRLELRLVPSASCLQLAYDVSGPPAGDTYAAGAVVLIVARRGHAAYCRRLPPLEALALGQLERVTSFEVLCERLGQAGAEAASLVPLLERWLDDGLLWRTPPRR